MFTHPDYRRQGVADKLMQWGVEKADELGLEMWLNATPGAIALYKKHGFVPLQENNLVPTTENPSSEWNEFKDGLNLAPACVMWRPIGGDFVDGKTIKPWEQN